MVVTPDLPAFRQRFLLELFPKERSVSLRLRTPIEEFFLDCLTLEDGTDKVVPNCQQLPIFARNIPEERRSHLHRVASLKSRIIHELNAVTQQSIAAAFWSLSKFICRLSRINRSVSLSLFFFLSTYPCEEAFSHMNTTESKYRRGLNDENLKYCLCWCLSNYVPISVRYRKICSVMHHLRNTEVNKNTL